MKSQQILWNLDELLKSYKAKYFRGGAVCPLPLPVWLGLIYTTYRMKFSDEYFLGEFEEICSFLWIFSVLPKDSLTNNPLFFMQCK